VCSPPVRVLRECVFCSHNVQIKQNPQVNEENKKCVVCCCCLCKAQLILNQILIAIKSLLPPPHIVHSASSNLPYSVSILQSNNEILRQVADSPIRCFWVRVFLLLLLVLILLFLDTRLLFLLCLHFYSMHTQIHRQSHYTYTLIRLYAQNVN